MSDVVAERSQALECGPITTRYVMLKALSEVKGNSFASAAELNLIGSSGQALSRSGWVATVDSFENGYAAANTLDGSASSMWHTRFSTPSPYPHWVKLDLGAAQTVSGLRYKPRTDNTNGVISDYEIYVSTDGVNWGNPVKSGDFADLGGPTTEKTVSFDGGACPPPPPPPSGGSGGTTSGGTASGGTTSGGTASGGTTSGGTASGGTASAASGGDTGAGSRSAGGSARYVMLKALSEIRGNSYASGAELNLLGSSGQVLSRTGWTATADSFENGYAPSSVLDGNNGSIWHTRFSAPAAPYPHWVKVDLGAATTITGLKYKPRVDNANGVIGDYEIYLSNDGVNWGSPVAAGDFADMGAATAEKTVTFASSGTGGTGGSAGSGGSAGTTGSGGSAGSGSAGSPPQTPTFPLSISANRRYFQGQNGVPFPILGDSGWEASHNLDDNGRNLYLNDRVARGFNAVLQQVIDRRFTVNRPPRDVVGNLPFSKRLDGNSYTGSPNGTKTTSGRPGKNQYPADPYTNVNTESPDFTSPTDAYFARLDSYVSQCAQLGIEVFMWPAYVGYGAGDDGWMAEMVANDAVIGAGSLEGKSFANAAKSKLWNYGAWLADHYKAAPNIVWVHGGDYGDQAANGGVFTAAQKAAVDSLFAGMKSVPGQKSNLHTGHWSRASLATDLSFSAGAFDVEAIYATAATAQWGRTGYAHSPTAPAFMLEGYYDGNSRGGSPLRRAQWWSLLSNVAGYFYGHEEIWVFDTGWQNYLNAASVQDVQRLNGFVRSIPWYELVPSGLGGMKTLITAGGGTANPQTEDYVAAAATPSGKLLVAYVPAAHTGAFTVDLTALSGQVHTKWFNPTNGAYTDVSGDVPNTGTRQYQIPGSNGTSQNDWVLVLSAP